MSAAEDIEERASPPPPASSNPLPILSDARQIRLLKVPKFVVDEWARRPHKSILGVYCRRQQHSKSNVDCPKTCEELLLGGTQGIQALDLRTSGCERTYLLLHSADDSAIDAVTEDALTEAEFGAQMSADGLAIEAAIVETVTASPALQDANYHTLLKSRGVITARGVQEETQPLTDNGRHESRLFRYYQGSNAAAHDTDGGDVPAPPQRRRPLNSETRKDELRLKLLETFESVPPANGAEGHTLGDLVRLTGQSPQALRPLLDELALVQNGSGDKRRVVYALRPEYAASSSSYK